MNRSLFSLILCAFFMSAPLAFAQAPAAPPPFTNLQFYPKDTAFPKLIADMQGFRQALGVACVYCHEAPDRAADTKPAKKTARVMLAMVRDLNAKLPSDISTASGKPAAEIVRVGCATCHRGVPIPKQLVDIVLDAGRTKGAPAAIAEYRDLRKQFYGNQSYDFTDLSLFLAAQRSIAATKPDDAIAYANLNLEFNPMSGRSYEVMSQAYVAKMDAANAIAAMEKAVATEPMNKAFATELNDLKKPK
jgi:hypothetical protein